MRLGEERMKWKHDATPVNKLANGIVQHLIGAGAPTVTVMSADLVLRSYLQWLHSAQRERSNPEQTRAAAVMVISAMIMEMAGRMRTCDNEDNTPMPQALWINEFVESVIDELEEDMKVLMREKNSRQPPPGAAS